jgi:hypothetical protein
MPRVHAVHDAGFSAILPIGNVCRNTTDRQSHRRSKETAADYIDAIWVDQAYQDFALGGVRSSQNNTAKHPTTPMTDRMHTRTKSQKT